MVTKEEEKNFNIYELTQLELSCKVGLTILSSACSMMRLQ